MQTISSLTKRHLDSSVALAGAMLFEFNVAHPDRAPSIEAAIANGERLELSITFADDGQEIRLNAISDYDERRLIASIPVPAIHGH